MFGLFRRWKMNRRIKKAMHSPIDRAALLSELCRDILKPRNTPSFLKIDLSKDGKTDRCYAVLLEDGKIWCACGVEDLFIWYEFRPNSKTAHCLVVENNDQKSWEKFLDAADERGFELAEEERQDPKNTEWGLTLKDTV